MIAVIVGIIGLLIVLLVLMTMGPGGQGPAVPAQKCADNTMTYVNANLVQQGTTASLVSVDEVHGLYEVKIKYQAQDMSLYTSRDCSLLFAGGAITMNGPKPTPAPTKAPVKTARPAVDLYVMAFCPYGTQAETVMRPVQDLLGGKADIRVRYITTVSGQTLDAVSSLHGPSEAKEDAFQVCLAKSNPGAYWEYLRLFDTQCYPKWSDSAALDTCRKNVTATLELDHAAIETCSTGAEGMALLKSDADASDANSAGASPTLIINGVKYAGARNPEAFKQAICNSFETAPEECKTILSGTSSAAAGNC
jgi:protein-disulfide isomerase